ncbi:copper homeostasis protein CutC [Ampelomyces quisqualis]|uniref:Copper homeostasis protein cutC homolog n=1 Tax=Ampelomyces quisqualis TaxID=50730 RepID=A0A6A5QQS3_AMPQU|nr:copper homeostasis protein CutC [Ampelomyces quisqualis]
MLEIACFTPSSALKAATHGADRIELCAHYSLGGLTPPIQDLLSMRNQLPPHIPINIMIRPRAGNFFYSTAEFESMRHSIALFAPLASGFVFGILDGHGRVDVARNSELVDIAAPLACTFHRAIDEIPAEEVHDAVEKVVACGFKSLLTSGGGKNAEEGIDVVKRLREKFGTRIEVVMGGGVRSGNVGSLKRRAGVEWIHSAAITGEGEEVDGEEVRRIKEVDDEGGMDGCGNRDQEVGDG